MKRKTTKNTRNPDIPQELVEQLVSHLTLEGTTLGELERVLEQVKQQVGKRSLDEVIARMPPENRRRKRCPRCGRLVAVRTAEVPRTVETLSGTQTFKRNYHYCCRCKKGFYPRDAQLGLPESGELSEELEKRVLDFSLNEPYEEASERFELHYGCRLSANQFRQVTKRMGTQLEACDMDTLQLELFPCQREPANVLYAMTDGSMVSMQTGDWREVKVGAVFRDTNHVPGSKTRRGIITNARYVAVLGGQTPFFNEMKSALEAEEADRATKVVWLADGAKGNWTLAQAACPNAIQILDIVHAVENGMKCGKTLLGETHSMLPLWQSVIEHHLYRGEVEELIDQLFSCIEPTSTKEQLDAINTLVGYYSENRERMRYNEYLEQGLMIGSGAVESAHRHVIQKRMKQAGQHWAQDSGRRMAHLRAAYKTAGAQRCYDAIRAAYRRTQQRGTHWQFPQLINVIPIKKAA